MARSMRLLLALGIAVSRDANSRVVHMRSAHPPGKSVVCTSPCTRDAAQMHGLRQLVPKSVRLLPLATDLELPSSPLLVVVYARHPWRYAPGCSPQSLEPSSTAVPPPWLPLARWSHRLRLLVVLENLRIQTCGHAPEFLVTLVVLDLVRSIRKPNPGRPPPLWSRSPWSGYHGNR